MKGCWEARNPVQKLSSHDRVKRKVKKVGIMNYLVIEDRHAAKYVHDGLGRRGFLGWDGLRKTFLSFHFRGGG